MYHCKLPEPGRKPGGVEVFVHRLAGALAERGHEVRFFSYSPRPADARYRVTQLRPPGAGDSMVMRQYVMPWRFNFGAFDGHDVVHFHGDDWFWLRRGLPSVRTFYGSALNEARTAASWRRRIDKAAVFGLELLAGHLADATYGIGPDSQIIYQTDGLLGLGVDAPAEASRPHPRPAILFIGTWSGRKRGAMLHRVFADTVRARVPEAELWMVSDACEPAPGVTWFRSPGDLELGQLLSRAWVFCLPSTYEGFGIPYLEAMSHGVPVVATPNIGAEMLLEGGRAGMIASDEQLGEALVRALTDDSLRERLGREGRRRAADFSWDAVTEAYEAAYRLAIARWSDRRQLNARAPAASR